jgi:thiamine-phosphate pyrophosphorylase
MTLCLVTDRRARPIVEQCVEAVRAGVDLIQVRERDLDGGPLAALVAELVQLTRGTPTRVVVNDRLDVALACRADGVHLRGDSVSPAAARSIAPAGFLIGRSVRGVEEATAVAPEVDYLIAGTVFPTRSKAGLTEWLGVEGLARICRAVRVPVLAIGGMTTDRLAEVAGAGAAGVAAIGLFAGQNPPLGGIVADARLAWGEAGRRFDTAKPAS